MTKSGIAELRRLLRTQDDGRMSRTFFGPWPQGTSFETFIACHAWTQATPEEVLLDLKPAELRMFLQLVLYAETDK